MPDASAGKELQIVIAQPTDLARYLALMEEVAEWLAQRGIRQWPVGSFREAALFYAESINQQEVWLAFFGDELVGALRLLPSEPIVWPEVKADDALYLFSLAVRRAWAAQQLGRHLLMWAEAYAVLLGKAYLRLDCLTDNQVLRDYYTQAGFVECGEIAAQYPAPVGTLHLRRFEKRLARI